MPSGTWASLMCHGVLPSILASGLTPTPLPGAEQVLLPQAGIDKSSPETPLPLICVGQSGPVLLLCVATA